MCVCVLNHLKPTKTQLLPQATHMWRMGTEIFVFPVLKQMSTVADALTRVGLLFSHVKLMVLFRLSPKLSTEKNHMCLALSHSCLQKCTVDNTVPQTRCQSKGREERTVPLLLIMPVLGMCVRMRACLCRHMKHPLFLPA